MNAYLSRFITDDELTQLDLRHREITEQINSPSIGDAAVGAYDSIQSGIEDRMVATHASTIEGMRAKARTLRRLMATDLEATGGSYPLGADDIGRMAWSLLTDVLGEQSGTVEPPPMPLDQMVSLYEALRTISSVILGLTSQRCFDNDRMVTVYEKGLNRAGLFLDDLNELVSKAFDRIANIAAVRRIDDECSDEFSERAHILIQHEINTNGITSAATLAADLYREPEGAR